MHLPHTPLRRAIFESGKHQQDIARRTGIDPTRLSKLVNGWDRPRPHEVEKLTRLLKVSADQLFPGTPQPLA